MSERTYLTRTQEIGLALASAVVTANAYYIHPIIAEVADHFGVTDTEIGFVPALNQLALAVGIFLLLPLGDRFSNRTLTMIFVSAQTASLAVMTLSENFFLFSLGSTALGFFTIAPYLLPAYTSKRVAPERLGQVTAQLTAGVIFGLLVARVGAGVVTELYGWRTVYWIATSLMLAMTVMLPLLMERGAARQQQPVPYLKLLGSLFALARANPDVLRSGVIQALNFGAFIALWLGLALHLTSDSMGYGVDTVGYLAGMSAISILSTPRIGRWADRIGPRKARARLALVQVFGLALMWPLGHSVWLMLLPLFLVNLVGPGVDVTSRMTYLAREPELRTRLTTIYVVIMFMGGGVGSVLGTGAYDRFGWPGTAGMLLAMSATQAALAWWAARGKHA